MLPRTEPAPFYVSRWAHAPQAQGNEGKKVFAKAEAAYRHWNERSEVLLMSRAREDVFSYGNVPPSQVFHVKTRYVYRGKGRPQPFDLDDE